MRDPAAASSTGDMATTRRAPHRRLALRAAALFDGIRTTPLTDPLLLVDEGRIVAVETGTRVDPPDGYPVVDLGGATLLPGLIDTHVHLAFDAGPDPVAALIARDDGAVLDGMVDAGRRALRAGITTVRDLGDRGYLAVGLRERDDPGLPTIVTAGPPVTTPGGHCHFMGGATPAHAGEAELRAAVRERAERGVDVIKVMASGGFLTPGSTGFVPQFDRDELAAIVDEAHRHGLPVTAHAHSTASIAAALDAGVDGIEHCSFASPEGVDTPLELIERLARRRIAIGATVGVLPGSTPPPHVAARLDGIIANLGRLHRAGAPLVAGTDAGIGIPKPHDVLPYGIEHLVQVGLTKSEALRAATSGAAGVCGLADRKGRIAPGFDADLLAVDGNPLDDLSALHRVTAVYHRGHPIDLANPGTDPATSSPETGSPLAAAPPHTGTTHATSSPHTGSPLAASSPYTGTTPATSSPHPGAGPAISSPETGSPLTAASPPAPSPSPSPAEAARGGASAVAR